MPCNSLFCVSVNNFIANYLSIWMNRLQPAQFNVGGIHCLDYRRHLGHWGSFICPDWLRWRVSAACCIARLQHEGVQGVRLEAPEEELARQTTVLQVVITENIVGLVN